MSKSIKLLTALVLLSACAASGPPSFSYPAFIQVNELSDVFMASLPGVRAKQLSGDQMSRRTSNRVDLPPAWEGTSGGEPGRSMEIFVIAGEITIADIKLSSGGYVFLPAGSLGFNIKSYDGAQVLYFVNDVDPESIIRSPIIIDSNLLDWEDSDKVGVTTKELRNDPGNGARTWLLRVATGASLNWESSSVDREGYLITGNQQYAECANGRSVVWQYSPGGYYVRPGNTISGGPESVALTQSIWVLREIGRGSDKTWSDCVVQPAPVEQ